MFRRGDEEALPLYEGQLANRYDHRAKTYEGYNGNKYGRKPNLPQPTNEQKADPAFEIEPRYWMPRPVVAARLAARVGDRAMFAFRDVSRPWTDQRSAKGTLIPRRPATDTVPMFAVRYADAFEFAAIFNSTVFDFLVRGHMPGAHVKALWMLAQIPTPVPGLDVRISDNARALSLTSRSIAAIFDAQPHVWDPGERYRLDIATDALIARAYGLDRQAYGIVLDSFEVMARAQTQAHGYYTFKEDCLAALDRVADETREEAIIGST